MLRVDVIECTGSTHRACRAARVGRARLVVHRSGRLHADVVLELTRSPLRLTRNGLDRVIEHFRTLAICGWLHDGSDCTAAPDRIEYTKVHRRFVSVVSDDLAALLYMPGLTQAGAEAHR